ncbi:protein of unknown function [Pararobbsia alpina]
MRCASSISSAFSPAACRRVPSRVERTAGDGVRRRSTSQLQHVCASFEAFEAFVAVEWRLS